MPRFCYVAGTKPWWGPIATIYQYAAICLALEEMHGMKSMRMCGHAVIEYVNICIIQLLSEDK